MKDALDDSLSRNGKVPLGNQSWEQRGTGNFKMFPDLQGQIYLKRSHSGLSMGAGWGELQWVVTETVIIVHDILACLLKRLVGKCICGTLSSLCSGINLANVFTESSIL